MKKMASSSINSWPYRGRTIENNNFTVNSNIDSSNINTLQLKTTLPIPMCDVWSPPAADNQFYYYSTAGTYTDPSYNSFGQVTNSFTDGPGNVFKINRSTLKIVQQVPFSTITGFSNDICRSTPVLYGNYVYLGSSKIGKNGTVVCVDKNDLSRVIWSTQLTPNSPMGFTGANAIVVDLRTLPDPSTITNINYSIQENANILYQRQQMLRDHPVVIYIGTSSLEELNVPMPTNRPLQNGSLVCLDALTGEILWNTSMLPQQYIGGDLLNIDSLRYSTTTGLLVAYADCRVVVSTGQQLISYVAGTQKTENQLRLYSDSLTTLFFQLGAVDTTLPTYVNGLTILLARTDGTQVSVTFDFSYGTTIQSADAFATGQIIGYTGLVGQTTIPANINGCFILEPLYPRDIMSMEEASGMNYTGCSVWGPPIVFDSLRWQIVISTGNNYSIPFDETNWVQGGQTNQINNQLTVLYDKYLDDVAAGADQEVLDADLAAIQTLTDEQNVLTKFISIRGQQNIFNSICSIDSASGSFGWIFKASISDVWSLSQLVFTNNSVLTGTPWGEDADFGMGAHIYRDLNGNSTNDLYVNISKGGVLVSLYANSGQVKYSSVVGPYFAAGAACYSSATDGRYFYAVIMNGNPTIPSFTIILNGDTTQTKTFVYQQSYVIKYDPFNGHILWAVNVGNLGQYTASQPLVSNDILYVPNLNGFMELFNIADGSFIKQLTLPSSGFTPPLLLENTLFISSGYKFLQGFFFPPVTSFSSLSDPSPISPYFAPCISIQIYDLSSSPPCFNEGTKILCYMNNKEIYTNIQDIKNGDLVKTYLHGYRLVKGIGKNTMINNPNKTNTCMFCLPKQFNMLDDLIVTGDHSILVDTLPQQYTQKNKIDDKFLLPARYAKLFNQVMNTDKYTYYHLYLDNNGDKNKKFGIWANNILTETTNETDFSRSFI